MEGGERKLSYPIIFIDPGSHINVYRNYHSCEDGNWNKLPSGKKMSVLSALVEENEPNEEIEEIKRQMDLGIFF